MTLRSYYDALGKNEMRAYLRIRTKNVTQPRILNTNRTVRTFRCISISLRIYQVYLRHLYPLQLLHRPCSFGD